MEVTGRGKFPLDQCRRYEMFPIMPGDVVKIESSFMGFAASQQVTLGMYASSLAADAPCIARFASFGFTAITLEVWKDDELFYKDGEVVVKESCTHSAYSTFGRQAYPYEIDRGPYCPTCDDLVEL